MGQWSLPIVVCEHFCQGEVKADGKNFVSYGILERTSSSVVEVFLLVFFLYYLISNSSGAIVFSLQIIDIRVAVFQMDRFVYRGPQSKGEEQKATALRNEGRSQCGECYVHS